MKENYYPVYLIQKNQGKGLYVEFQSRTPYSAQMLYSPE